MKIHYGVLKLLNSAKGTLALIILAISGTGLLMGRCDGTAFAAIVSIIGVSYFAARVNQINKGVEGRI